MKKIPNLNWNLIKYNLCFVEAEDRFLMLLRNKKPNQGLWNGLGGKVETGESFDQAARRELKEESGFDLGKSDFKKLGLVTWSYDRPGLDSAELVGGMMVFGIRYQGKIWEEAIDSREGKLAWKPKKWVFDKDNNLVVENIPIFLPALLSEKNQDFDSYSRHHFIYQQDNNFISHQVEGLEELKD